MRLIDADALKDRLQNLAYDDWNQGICTSWADAYRECADMVDEQPTIEPKRKTGKWNGYNADNPDWLRDDGSPVFLICSKCHGIVMNNCSAHWNFCPNCGADMKCETE